MDLILMVTAEKISAFGEGFIPRILGEDNLKAVELVIGLGEKVYFSYMFPKQVMRMQERGLKLPCLYFSVDETYQGLEGIRNYCENFVLQHEANKPKVEV